MVFKESSVIAYALYMHTDEEIDKNNIFDYLSLLDRDGYLYYKITDTNMIKAAEEYRDKWRLGQPIVLDMIRFNRIFKVVKDVCRDKRLSRNIVR